MPFLYYLTYLTAVVFVVGVVRRFLKFAHTPAHLRWELYPVAHEGKRSIYGGSYLEEGEWWNKTIKQNKLGELGVMLPEIILLKGLWEHNRKMWLSSFLMHHGVYWLAGTAALLFLHSLLNLSGIAESALGSLILQIIPVFGVVGYCAGLTGTLGMLRLRHFDRGLNKFSSFATYFNLYFLLANFLTGFIGLAFYPNFYSELLGFFWGLLGAESGALSALTILHLTLGILFVLYLPFTHMTHFFTKWFTYHAVRWNDEPNRANSHIEKNVAVSLSQKPTWSAKHIGADGKKNWVEIALSEVPDDKK